MSMLPARRPLRTEDVPTSLASPIDIPLIPAAMLDAAFACEGADPELFFPNDPDDLEQALRLCRSCPVQTQCRDFGAATKSAGVWGGVLLKGGQPSRELFPAERGPRTKEA